MSWNLTFSSKSYLTVSIECNKHFTRNQKLFKSEPHRSLLSIWKAVIHDVGVGAEF